jgi:glycosyltransferase involved in cell wall biosynthesis
MSRLQSTAVSLTPVALEADSRALKIAASFARFGYRSVVIEGVPSGTVPRVPGVEIISLGSPRPESTAASRPRPRLLAQAIEALRRGRMGAAGELALLGAYRLHAATRFWLAPARVLPAAELYYLHSFEWFPLIRRAARRHHAVIAYDAHDFYQGLQPAAALPSFDRRRLLPLQRRDELACTRAADAFFTVSPSIAALHEGAFGIRPVVLRNCHDFRLECAASMDIRRCLGLAPEDVLLVFVGNYKAGIASAALFDAMARLSPKIHLALVGRGHRAFMPDIAARGLERRVHLMPAVPPLEIVPFVRSATIGILPYFVLADNYRGALPNGFFHLVAASLPCLYPPLPELQGLARSRCIGLEADMRSADAIVATLTTLLSQPDLLARAREGAAQLARENSWEQEEQILRRTIDAALAARRP